MRVVREVVGEWIAAEASRLLKVAWYFQSIQCAGKMGRRRKAYLCG